jgi:AcrR family transcriptional regulator
LFASRGFAATGTEDLVHAAGVTRGALYHHFADKRALFRAVVDAVQAEVGNEVEAAAAPFDDPWQQLDVGCSAFLRAATDPLRQRIMLVDGPAVLGWDAWRAMDSQYSLRSLKQVLSILVDEAVIADQPVDPLAHLLSGAMNEAALWVAQSSEPSRALREATSALGVLLSGLRLPGKAV